jgi:hypothetical protein
MRTKRMLLNLGIDPRIAQRSIRGLGAYRANKGAFLEQEKGSQHEFELAEPFPCLGDRYQEGGIASGHYFHQDLYVAQRIFDHQPERHVDVGSRVDGLVAHVAAFRPLEVLDIRPVDQTVRNITFRQRDIMETDPAWDAATDSLSCLHALEHFGLGRYGDPLDYYGYRKGWNNLVQMVKPGGRFYFSVPIGERQRIEFDAHRVFAVPYLRDQLIAPGFDVEAFAYVDDTGALHSEVDVASPDANRTFGLTYGCGIFTLRRH